MFDFAPPRPRRRPSLTPMIDVVFLLLVLFMLAARFGTEGMLELTLPGGGNGNEAWRGPPRLVEVLPDGLRLNGVAVAAEALPAALAPLMQNAEEPVLLRAEGGADLQRAVTVMDALTEAGLSRLVLVE